MGDEIDQIKAHGGQHRRRIDAAAGQQRAAPRAWSPSATRATSMSPAPGTSPPMCSSSRPTSPMCRRAAAATRPSWCNAGLHDAIHLPGWTPRRQRAAPAADRPGGRRGAAPRLRQRLRLYRRCCNEAVAAGIKIFPIGASGLDDQGEYIFRQFAAGHAGPVRLPDLRQRRVGRAGRGHRQARLELHRATSSTAWWSTWSRAKSPTRPGSGPVNDPAPAPVPVEVVQPAPVAPPAPAWVAALTGLRDAVARVGPGRQHGHLAAGHPARGRLDAPGARPRPTGRAAAQRTLRRPHRTGRGSPAHALAEVVSRGWPRSARPTCLRHDRAAPGAMSMPTSASNDAGRTAPLPPLPIRVVERTR